LLVVTKIVLPPPAPAPATMAMPCTSPEISPLSSICHNPGIAGIAAPVFNSGKAVLGSVGLAMAARHVTPETLPGFAEQVVRAAEQVTAALRARGNALW
jgi:hypothetical protein